MAQRKKFSKIGCNEQVYGDDMWITGCLCITPDVTARITIGIGEEFLNDLVMEAAAPVVEP